MSFDRPVWLLAIPALAAFFFFVQRYGLVALGPQRRKAALIIRLTMVSMMILALAGLRLGSGGDRLSVVFVVDRSDSVGAAGQEQALSFIRKAVATKGRSDLAGIVTFGKEPRLEFRPTDQPSIGRLESVPEASATDIARALRLAAALFPEGTKRRIVVLTDGKATRGDALREAARLGRQGIVVEGLTIAPFTGGDVLLEGIDAPERVRRGEGFRVGVTVASTVTTPAHLVIARDGNVILRKDLTLKPGTMTVVANDVAEAPGVRRYTARIEAASDAIAENNGAAAAVIVEGPPRVLIVEAESGESASLASALRAGGTTVDVRSPEQLPSLGDLLLYASTVLVDVPADRLTTSQIDTLKAAVAEAGAGLVTVGGESSYGIGGYRGSALESLLPLESEIKDPKRRPSVAEAIVVDTSGSMGRCHCRGGGRPQGGMEGGGIDKTDIARSGAARAIRALTKDDVVGVLAFNTTAKWVVPLQKLPPEHVVENGLAGLRAGGGTSVPQALRAAVAELKQQKAKLKHVILFTDGWTNQNDLVPAAEALAKEGITLSVVATGEGTGETLARMAEAGRGRFYAGTNLTDIPQVMMQEAILASRNYVNEGVFSPVVEAITPVTQDLTRAPSLLGYIGTSAKGAATVELSIGPSEEPLLARWRSGLGTVVSWTSDAKGRWAKPWVSWEGFRDFWTRTVRSSFAPAGAGGFEAAARATADGITIDVRANRALPPGAVAEARVVDPSLNVTTVTLERTGNDSFKGIAPVGEEGTTIIGVTVRDTSGVLFRTTTTASRAYSAEYIGGDPDRTLIPAMAKATRGRASITPAQAFDAAGLEASDSRRELWPLLALLAALLLPVDVAARRLVVSREDLRKARKAAATSAAETLVPKQRKERRRRRVAEQPREERIDRLLEAKRRARPPDQEP